MLERGRCEACEKANRVLIAADLERARRLHSIAGTGRGASRDHEKPKRGDPSSHRDKILDRPRAVPRAARSFARGPTRGLVRIRRP
jgi:hypothetical protein